MTKVKKNRRSGASRRKSDRKPSLSPWFWVIFGFSGGVLITLILFSSKIELPQIEEVHQSSSSNNAEQHASPSTEREFIFHELLTEKEIQVDAKPTTSSRKQKSYVMQCGSFKTVDMADTLKAKIAFSGLEAKILSSKSDSGTTWYRVTLGPYQSKRHAEKDRHKLQANSINGCQIW